MALYAYTQKLYLGSPASGHDAITRRNSRRARIPAIRAAAASSSSTSDVAYEKGQLERPKWAGETPLSRLVGAVISFKPIYSLLKLGARQVLISTAEKNDIPWREMTRQILESDVYKELESIQNPSLVFPDYYLSPFHAYDEGNLSWMAAAEAEPATKSMSIRAVPDARSADEATQVVRGNWLKAIEKHHRQHSGGSMVQDILDIGCSVGISTSYLADTFPSAKVIGLDLSPYFLSVAQFNERKRPQRTVPIQWIHANGEDTGLPSKSFDLVSVSLMFHECPTRAITNVIKESSRLLRPGGTIAIMDQAPSSKVLQNLSPVLFTLLKSTEPFLDEYYLTDLEGTLREAGFVNVTDALTDLRHRTVTATLPR